MKKLVREIIGIVVVAIVLGMSYNFTTTGMPLIFEPKEIKPLAEFDSMFVAQDTAGITATLPGNSTNASLLPDSQANSIDTAKTNPTPNTKPIQEVKIVNDQIVAEGAGKKVKVQEATYKNISFEQLKSKLDNPKIYIIDARSPMAFSEGHIKNAVNIDPQMENHGDYLSMLNNIPTDKVIVVYCDGGNCELSHLVISDLLYLGFKNIYLYYGGWDEWVKNKG